MPCSQTCFLEFHTYTGLVKDTLVAAGLPIVEFGVRDLFLEIGFLVSSIARVF